MQTISLETAHQFQSQGLIIRLPFYAQPSIRRNNVASSRLVEWESRVKTNNYNKMQCKLENSDYFSPIGLNIKDKYFLFRVTITDSSLLLILGKCLASLENIIYSSFFRPQIYFLQIYIPEHSVYYDDQPLGSNRCMLSYQDQCWREYLLRTGSMIAYLEYWAINKSIKGSKILVFWSEKLSLMVLLLSIRFSHLSHSTASIVVINSPKQPKRELNALRLNLIKQNSINLVTFVESKQLLLPEQLMHYDMVIGDSHIFHDDIITGFISGRDFNEGNVKNQVVYNIYSTLINTKLILVYDQPIQLHQQQHYCALQNQVLKLVSDGQSQYKQQVVSKLQHLHFQKQQPTIVIIESKSGIINCQNGSDSIAELNKEGQLIVPNTDSKNTDANVVNSSTILQQQFYHPKVIERMELQVMKKILPCRTRQSYGYLLYKLTQFKDIQVIAKDNLDLTYLAKFIIYLVRTDDMPLSVFYAQNSQFLCNLIAKINDGNLFIATNIIQRSRQMIEVLQHNKLSRLLHPIQVGEDISLFLDRQSIRLAVIDLVYLVQWQKDIFDSRYRVTLVLMKRNGNSNEIRTIEYLAKDKNIHIYVISKKQDKAYDVQCYHDFQWQSYSSHLNYPLNSYYFISKQSYILQPINPNDYPNLIIRRSMQTSPYNCQYVPDRIQDQKIYEQKYIMITDKYYMPYLIPKEQYNIFNIQQAEDEGIIQFLQSNLFSSDRVLFYGESTHNILINLIAIRIVKTHGSTTFTLLSEQKRIVLQLSAVENGLANSYQISEIETYDEFGVEGLLLVYKPTVVFIIPKYIERDMPFLKELVQESLVVFKYTDYLQAVQKYLFKMIQTFRVYQIVFVPSIQMRDNCKNFIIEQLTGDNFALHKYGWFVIVL